jgi:Mitochondrial ribosomal protein (VAR1)
MYYKQYILFNNLKYKNIYILPLTKLINKIYKKKIVFNIITLKNYYLNSDILSQILSAKTRNRKNNILRVLKASIRKIKTPVINQKLIVREKTKLTGVQNFIIKDSLSKDNINKILNNFYLKKDEANISHNVLNTLKYKTVSGIRLEASGRLTRRIVAQRSVFKLKYIGSVKNIDSSYKGLSSVILRGNLKSNIQFTKLRSKTRIGAFGLKG